MSRRTPCPHCGGEAIVTKNRKIAPHKVEVRGRFRECWGTGTVVTGLVNA